MRFSNFIGNERVQEQLGALYDAGRFPHAVVIEGEQGIGKKTLARLLACMLVCRGEHKPCMECVQCRKTMKKIHPDVLEYIPSGTANSFHVDTVREIINDVYMQPNEADYKVYILADANCMNASAQNALLKVLEEPPEYAVFILTVSAKSALLSTVLSRSVVVSLEGVPLNDGAVYISSKNQDIDFETAKQTLEAFNGNIGRALQSLQDTKTKEIIDVCNKMCRLLVEDNEYALLVQCAFFQKDRQSVVFACEFLKKIFRDALLGGNGCDYISGQKETAEFLKTRLTRQKLLNLISVCDELCTFALMNANNSLLITKICYTLRQAVDR